MTIRVEKDGLWLANVSDVERVGMDYANGAIHLYGVGGHGEVYRAGFFPDGIKLYGPEGEMVPLLKEVEPVYKITATPA